MRKLKNLNPKWIGIQRPGNEGGEGVMFDCPNCENEKCHPIVVHFTNPVDGGPSLPGTREFWTRSGGDGFDFGTLSVSPSINYPCFHGWLEMGRVFEMKETPLIVFTTATNGQPGPVAMSPLQTIAGCQAAITRAQGMLGITPEVVIKVSEP